MHGQAGANVNNLIHIKPSPVAFKVAESLRFCLLNAISVVNKSLFIKDYVVDNSVDIMAITETWLRSDQPNNSTIGDLCPTGYFFKHSPRTSGTGGGIGLLCRSNIRTKLFPSTKQFRSFEIMQFKLHLFPKSVHLVVVYRPPPCARNGPLTTTMFFDEFIILMEHLAVVTDTLVICGDFNFHVDSNSDTAALKFMDLICSFGLKQNIRQSTQNTSGHTLDLIITRQDEVIADHFNVVNPMLSDHCAVLCNFLSYKPPVITKEISLLKIRSIDFYLLESDLMNSSLFEPSVSDIGELVCLYHNTLLGLLDAYAPIKK
jgi:exonuclease III